MKLLFFKIISVLVFVGITLSFIENKSETVEIFKLKNEKNSRKWKNTDFEYRLIFGYNHSSEIDENFISKLKLSGYKKNNLQNEKTLNISAFLNSKKEGHSKYETGCKKIFRDIIVYKRQNKIVKVIKICTNCYANQVFYENDETEVLLSYDEYDELKELLKK